jgi:ribosomal protein S18 acetylase RimI-like enzyme
VEELGRRLFFVINGDGKEVGTITSWWDVTGARRDPSIHWFAVNPEYQGLGLGKALVSECLVYECGIQDRAC